MSMLFALCLLQEKTTWGKIEFIKVGAAGTEYKDALKEAEKKNQPVLIFFT